MSKPQTQDRTRLPLGSDAVTRKELLAAPETADRWSEAVDLPKMVGFTQALSRVVVELARA